jgi:hypothetical protein
MKACPISVTVSKDRRKSVGLLTKVVSFNGNLQTQLSLNLGVIYLFYGQIGDRRGFETAFLSENTGFADFLDYDDSPADFNFRNCSNYQSYPPIQRPNS